MRRSGAWPSSAIVAAIAILLSAPGAAAQRLSPALKGELQAAIAVEQKLPQSQRKLFSGALQNYLAFAHTLLDPPDRGPDDEARPLGAAPKLGIPLGKASGPLESGSAQGSVAQVSNLGFDLLFSRLGGFTQNTTSSAWCGRNVVVGFNDTTSALDSIVLQAINTSGEIPPTSQLGVSFSSDNGKTFTDLALLDPGSFPNDLIGNPSLACASPRHFYYASAPFFSGTPDLVNFTSAVGLNISEDGGRHWSAPLSAVAKDVFFHILDKEWLAIDPSNRNRIYITYTDFDNEGVFGSSAVCPGSSRIAIEMVSSMDGGRTWSTPSVVREDCIIIDPATGAFNGHSATGSQVAVGSDGAIYTSYLLFGSDGSEQIVFRRSSDQGASFSPEVAVADVTPAGINGFLQGFFFDQGFHSMAVDNSRRSSRGTIYLAWSDGRDNSQIDVVSPNGQYSFGDILLSRSTDRGTSWSNPGPVSATDPNFKGPGRDQFQPGIAVNSEGKLAVCYSDRRNDSQNNLIDHYCSVSENQGATFNDFRLTTSGWVPAHATDELVGLTYLGDYDVVTAEATGQQKGFFSSFQVETNDMPNVQGRSF